MFKALLVFIVIFPFVFIPGYVNITIFKFAFLNIFSIGLWIYCVFKIKHKNQLKKPNKAEIYLLLFILMVIISTILSVDINQSLIGAYTRNEGFPVFISYASLFFFTSRFVNPQKKVIIIKTLVILAIFMCIYGILQHYNLDIISHIVYPRSYSFFNNPDFFGSYLTLMFPLAVIMYFLAKYYYEKIFYLLTSSMIFLTLLFSEARSGWVGTFTAYVVILLLVVLKRKQLWKKAIIISLAFLIIFASVNYTNESQVITSRINSTITQVSSGDINHSGSGRIFIWRTAFPLLKDYWLHGSGPDTFGLVFPNDSAQVKAFLHNYIDKAHNEYLQIAVTLGIPALIFYLLFLFEIIKSTLKSVLKLNEENKFYYYALLSGIVGYIVQAFFNISVVVVAPYFWIILGLSYLSIKEAKEASKKTL